MKRWLALGVAVVLAGLVAFVLVWFEPQALVIDDRVDQAPPVLEPDPGDETPPTTGATAVVAEGALRGVKGHDVRGGTAQVHRLPDGSHVLRLDELDAQNGPDLHVYLSAAPADGDSDAHDDDFIELGPLAGNIGSSNYDVPATADLDRYATAVIWCERFSVGFAVAPLVTLG